MGDDNGIVVERDGIILGWKLVVALAAAVIGVYLTTIIAPLEDALVHSQQDIVALKQSHDLIRTELSTVKSMLEASKYEHMATDKDIIRLRDRVFNLEKTK